MTKQRSSICLLMVKTSAAEIPEGKTEESQIPLGKKISKIEGKLENSNAEKVPGFAAAYHLALETSSTLALLLKC